MAPGIHVKKCSMALGGREIKNPLLRGAALFLIVGLVLVILAWAMLMAFSLLLGISTLLGLVFLAGCGAAALLVVGHPVLRACGRQGFLQTKQERPGQVSLTITTAGALKRK